MFSERRSVSRAKRPRVSVRCGRLIPAARQKQPAPRWTSARPARRNESGFTLLEVVCVLAIVAMLVAILLPRVPVATSQARLEAYAVEVAALLKADRNAALLRRGVVAASIDAPARQVSSGSSQWTVRIPDDVLMDSLLPEFCNGRPALSSVTFFGTGMSCGGAIRLTRFGSGFDVRVNWLTGDIEIVARRVD